MGNAPEPGQEVLVATRADGAVHVKFDFVRALVLGAPVTAQTSLRREARTGFLAEIANKPECWRGTITLCGD